MLDFFFKLYEQAFLQTIAMCPYYAGPQILAMRHNLKLVLIPHKNTQNTHRTKALWKDS